MIGTELHWVEGPWRGRLALSARPRGGDWLEDEVTQWQRSGIDSVLSLLEHAEENDLDLTAEKATVKSHGMKFFSLPIPDRQVPEHEADLNKMISEVDRELSAGKNVLLHCRQGVGRTGLVAACLWMSRGFTPAEALETLSEARGITVPETPEQRRWIFQHEQQAEPAAASR